LEWEKISMKVEDQANKVDRTLELNKQAAAKDYYLINVGGRVQPRERDLLKPQPGDDVCRKAFQRSL
jgi:hypothetical protein